MTCICASPCNDAPQPASALLVIYITTSPHYTPLVMCCVLMFLHLRMAGPDAVRKLEQQLQVAKQADLDQLAQQVRGQQQQQWAASTSHRQSFDF